MKVVHLTTVHPPFDNRIFHKQAKTLAKADYSVTLIAQHERDEVVEGVKILTLPQSESRFYRILFLTWGAFWLALRQKATVYHFHDPELIPVGLALKALTRARVIYDIHEDYPQQVLSKGWLPAWLRPWIARGMAGLEGLAARVFDGLVAATPTIAQRFPASKTVVVRNFPLLEELASARSGLPYTQRPPRVVYIGGITTIRGAVEMVQAIAQVEGEVELILAGAFESPALQERLTRLPGWQRTRFVGWLNRGEVANLLSQVRIGLVIFHPEPNHIHAQPNKLFEYMAAGIPFVASDFPLWREIGQGAGLFVDPQKPDEIAQAIQWLLTHPREAQAMGARGRQLVETKYNWEHEARQLLRLYERLLA